MKPKKGDLVKVAFDEDLSYVGTVVDRTFSWATMGDMYLVKIQPEGAHSRIVWGSPDEVTVMTEK